MKSTLLRIFAAMMALVMMVCCFTACDNTKDPNEEITKPSDVQGPDVTDDLVDFDGVEWDDPSTTNSTTTTTQSSKETTTKKNPTSTNPTQAGSTGGSTITKEDLQQALNDAGYAYDEEQQVYYSTLEP